MKRQIAVTEMKDGTLVQSEYKGGSPMLFKRVKGVGRKWEYVHEYRAFTPMDGIWLVRNCNSCSTMILPWGEARDIDCGRYADLYAKYADELNRVIAEHQRGPYSIQGLTELVLKTIARKENKEKK